MTYIISNPPITADFREMQKGELKEYANWYFNNLPERIKILEEAVKSLYPYWQADYSPESLLVLGEWFYSQAEERPMTQKELKEFDEFQKNQKHNLGICKTTELTDKTISIAIDIGMYLSQMFLKNVPNLKWEINTKSKKQPNYGEPVLKGEKDSFNPSRMIITLAYGFIRKSKTPDRLAKLYEKWSENYFF